MFTNLIDIDLVNQLKEISKNKTIKEIIPGKDYISVTGKILDENDLLFGIDAVLDSWLTNGRYTDLFERELSKFFGSRYSLLVNSGSSANLLAFYTLTSPKLGERAIKPGDEVITVAAGFPTTINPIIQFGCVPVFLDIDIPTYNIKAEDIESALTSKTKAIMVAHTLGNPFNLNLIKEIAIKHNLWLIEDNCDALGAKYNDQNTGTFGDLATLSFYPAHHITMGEGGALLINNAKLKKIAESFRDWGRDCWCPSGKDNTCGERFCQQFGSLPDGYDHKYTYSHIGFNLKATDIQAAIGVSQLKKANSFVEKRKINHKMFYDLLKPLEDYFILPEATYLSNPSWFGFMITIRDNKKIQRNKLVEFLEENKIGTRLLFGGNLTKQPAYQHAKYIIHNNLINTDKVMNDSFWIGVWPGINQDHYEYIYSIINKFIK